MMVKILYVEDDERVRRAVFDFLKNAISGAIVVQASTFTEATKALKEQGPFEAILSDYYYSGVRDGGLANSYGTGGLDLITHVRQKAIEAPFIFFSGCSEKEIREDITRRGLELPARIFSKRGSSLGDIADFIKSQCMPEIPSPVSNTSTNLPGPT